MRHERFRRIGEYFKAKREERGVTQEEIAQRLGYGSKQIVSNWERGICQPPLNQVSALIAFLKLDYREVLDLFIEVTRDELLEKFAGKKRKVRSRTG